MQWKISCEVNLHEWVTMAARRQGTMQQLLQGVVTTWSGITGSDNYSEW